MNLRRFIPRAFFSGYHFLWALGSALWYGFPARRMRVIGVTGTKGKTTTAELIAAFLAADGRAVALANSVRFAIGSREERNRFKMTMPGRGFLQRFLRRAARAGCTHAVIEMTSEGAAQSRHRFLALDALVFTNLAPEHIESHGSFAAYRAAKLSIARSLARSPKRPRAIVANADDPHGAAFLETPVERRIPFRRADLAPSALRARGARLSWRGGVTETRLEGAFNLDNIAGAASLAEAFGVGPETIRATLANFPGVPGRVERIEAGQPFAVIVDYAHTPESLTALYEAFPHQRKVCVLGATGGGRDAGKRARFGQIAREHCETVIITDEDPYDEDPRAIAEAVARGVGDAPRRIIMDRREAIRAALRGARAGDAVLVTGKGTDPFIMRAGGAREPWSDAAVARDELAALGFKKAQSDGGASRAGTGRSTMET